MSSLCPECLALIATNLSYEARKVLSVIGSNKLNKNELMLKANLSYSITFRAIQELEATLLLSYTEEGRSKIYSLSATGKKLFRMYEKLKRGA